MRWRFGFTRFASWSERPSGDDGEARGSSGERLECLDSDYVPPVLVREAILRTTREREGMRMHQSCISGFMISPLSPMESVHRSAPSNYAI